MSRPPSNFEPASTLSDTEARLFFEAFVEAFRTFNGKVIAQRYMAPYVSLGQDGLLQCFTSHEHIETYFDEIVQQYRQEGCRACAFKDMTLVCTGSASALASVTWELVDEQGQMLSTWRESYNLVRTGQGLRIFASIDHA